MSAGFAPLTARRCLLEWQAAPNVTSRAKTATRKPPIVSQALAPAPRGVRTLSKASEIPRAVALVVSTGAARGSWLTGMPLTWNYRQSAGSRAAAP